REKPSSSPTVRVGHASICFRIPGRFSRSVRGMNRMWQRWRSARSGNRTTANVRFRTVLFFSVFSRPSPNGSAPTMPIVMGESAFSNASAGHSTYFAKLKRKPALTTYSGSACASWDRAGDAAAANASARDRTRRRVILESTRQTGINAPLNLAARARGIELGVRLVDEVLADDGRLPAAGRIAPRQPDVGLDVPLHLVVR